MEKSGRNAVLTLHHHYHRHYHQHHQHSIVLGNENKINYTALEGFVTNTHFQEDKRNKTTRVPSNIKPIRRPHLPLQ